MKTANSAVFFIYLWAVPFYPAKDFKIGTSYFYGILETQKLRNTKRPN